MRGNNRLTGGIWWRKPKLHTDTNNILFVISSFGLSSHINFHLSTFLSFIYSSIYLSVRMSVRLSVYIVYLFTITQIAWIIGLCNTICSLYKTYFSDVYFNRNRLGHITSSCLFSYGLIRYLHRPHYHYYYKVT